MGTYKNVKTNIVDASHVPDNVIRALQLAGKIGFLSRGLWYDYFGNGSLRWKQRQFHDMVKNNLIVRHANPVTDDYFVLTKKSRGLLGSLGDITVSPPPISQIYHDEWIATWLLELERSGVATDWATEMELKCTQAKAYQLSRDLRNQKYPDAIFNVRALGKNRQLALEYERTPKGMQRYKNILWLYSRSDATGLVIFICENKFIRNAIEGRLKYLNIPSLWDRVALAMAADWRDSPLTAPLTIGTKTITLEQICERQAA